MSADDDRVFHHAKSRSPEGRFLSLGWPRAVAVAAARVGMDASLAEALTGTGELTAEQCLAWHAAVEQAGPLPSARALDAISQWVDAGVFHPDDRPPGISGGTALMCHMAGVAPDPGWGPRRRFIGAFADQGGGPEALCPTLVTYAAIEARQAPAIAAALLDAYRAAAPARPRTACLHHVPTVPGHTYPRSTRPCPWPSTTSEDALPFLRSLTGLDWADVTACMVAGMTPERARAHVASGAEMDPVRLVASLTR